MKTKRKKIIQLFKLAQPVNPNNRGVLVDYQAFLDALSGRNKEPSVKVKTITV